MNAKELKACSGSPAAFRQVLVIPGGRGPVKLGDCMAPFQVKDFSAMDNAFIALAKGSKPEVGRFWWERTKGASKDSDLAVMLLWLLAFSPRALTCQVGAADQDQADELRKAAKSILRLNPWLAEAVQVQAWTLLNPRTDATCEIVAADISGSHGARPDLLILNELSHVSKREFAENLLDNASKVPHGIVCIATNAGFCPSWQWDWRENARQSDRWCWSAFTQPAPWLDPAEIAEAKKRNPPQRFARLWEGQWVRGAGDALSAEDIEAAIVPDLLPADGSEADVTYYAGLDLGISRDHSALAVVGLKGGRIRLAMIRSWAPGMFGRLMGGKVDLTAVEEAILEADKRFHFRRLFFDQWQAELLGQQLQKAGVRVEGIPFTVASLTEMAGVVLERFHSRSIELYPDKQLLTDLHQLRLIDRGTSFRLDSPRSSAGHGDRATAFVLSLLAAERHPTSCSGAWEVVPPSREQRSPIADLLRPSAGVFLGAGPDDDSRDWRSEWSPSDLKRQGW